MEGISSGNGLASSYRSPNGFMLAGLPVTERVRVGSASGTPTCRRVSPALIRSATTGQHKTRLYKASDKRWLKRTPLCLDSWGHLAYYEGESRC